MDLTRAPVQCTPLVGFVYANAGANVFLTPDGHVKLGDFGCSVKLKNHTTMPGELKPCVGTPGERLQSNLLCPSV